MASIFLLSAILPLSTGSTAPQSPTIIPLIPNDSGWQNNLGEIHDLPSGFGWIDWLSNHPNTIN
jgi:hypothetical protein